MTASERIRAARRLAALPVICPRCHCSHSGAADTPCGRCDVYMQPLMQRAGVYTYPVNRP